MNSAPMIPTTAKEVCLYAYYVIKGWWLEAEAVIAKNPQWAYCYAFDVI